MNINAKKATFLYSNNTCLPHDTAALFILGSIPVFGVVAGFLLKDLLDIQTYLIILGCLVTITAFSVILIRFSVEHKEKEQQLFEQALLERNSTA